MAGMVCHNSYKHQQKQERKSTAEVISSQVYHPVWVTGPERMDNLLVADMDEVESGSRDKGFGAKI